jgi:predicted nuclease with RNAse H fold
MRTVGVDLAAQRGSTAGVVVEWSEIGGSCTCADVYEQLSDEQIVTLLDQEQDARVGIDAPFGWPAAFLRTVAQWDGAGVWPDRVELHELRFRYTDRFIREQVGWYPLSVSTDLISVTAFRCARILRQLAGDAPIGRVGGRVVEVYPAAALAVWDLPHKGYKGRKPPAPERRCEILDGLVEKAPLELTTEVVERCIASDHVLDSLICAMIARATQLDATHRPPVPPADVIRREGWIELPLHGSLASLGDRYGVVKRD